MVELPRHLGKMNDSKGQVKKAKYSHRNDVDGLSSYLSKIASFKILPKKTMDVYAKRASSGDTVARQRLIVTNLRFVVYLAKKYQNLGLPLSDLVSEGNIGLINAVEKFNPDRGDFITCAAWWIRQRIYNAICEQSRLIRLPANQVRELIQIQKAHRAISEIRGKEPDIAEIAHYLKKCELQVEQLLTISKKPVSLEARVHLESDSSPLHEHIRDSKYKTPEEALYQKSLKKEIERILGTLSRRDAWIIKHRFGLDGQIPLSLQRIGDILHLTRERIRQLQVSAFRRLQMKRRGLEC
jgi:RNA polymerase primary sigma factor